MKNYKLVDVLKLIFAINVVFIHTNLLDKNNFYLNLIYNTFFSMSVPFFFVTTGVLFGMQIKNQSALIITAKRVKNFLKLYLVWGALYFFIRVIKNCVITKNLDYIYVMLHELLVSTPGGAMWYIYACLWFFLVLYLLLKKMNSEKRVFKVLTVIYLLFYVITYSLMNIKLLENTCMYYIYLNLFINNSNIISNGIFIILGIWIGIYFENISSFLANGKYLKIVCTLSLVFFVIFRGYIYNESVGITILLYELIQIMVACGIAIGAFSIDGIKIDTILIRKMSIAVYLTHPIGINIWDMIMPKINCVLWDNYIIKSLFVLFVSLIISYVMAKNKKIYKLLIG